MRAQPVQSRTRQSGDRQRRGRARRHRRWRGGDIALRIEPGAGEFGGQAREHFQNGQAKHRMAPIGGNVGQRHQHESAVLQAGVRQDQLGRRLGFLAVQREVAPLVEGRDVGGEPVAIRNQVEVQRARTPPMQALAAKMLFYLVEKRQQIRRSETGAHGNRRVHKVATRTGGETWGLVEGADPLNLNSQNGNLFNCR